MVVGLLVVVGDLLVLADEVLLIGGLGLDLALILHEVLHGAVGIVFDEVVFLVGVGLVHAFLISGRGHTLLLGLLVSDIFRTKLMVG